MGKNVVIAQFFTNMYDALLKQTLQNVDIVKETHNLYESVARYDLELDTLINFVNHTKAPKLQKFITIKTFNHYPSNKFYFLRWEITFDYLLRHPEIENAALVDAGDVEMLNYPFDDLEKDMLYVGDENLNLTCFIIADDNKPKYVADFTEKGRYLQMLNAGILVGSRKILLEFLAIMVRLIVEDAKNEKFHPEKAHLGNYEMSLVNYVLYNMFPGRVCHGRKVATRFTYYERNSSAWFKHK
ncbi:hypothetical protein PT285_04600 [Lactobacillus sp. ESL0791]|uniref:hypothetical protein n=1 Tax=Lactobacillus sp. ESL0791 TaxID=2983234 RepID=UPI0023F6A00F|nr:hypothetical protein [Lactobacillus sp. ESL0791]MDF7638678.1 hypothetical protein [Lactobacillus sp. ESL0791]